MIKVMQYLRRFSPAYFASRLASNTACHIALLGLVTTGYLATAVFLTATIPPENTEQNYSLQALGWLTGRLDLPPIRYLVDVAVVNGHYHLMAGPLPAVFMVPLVAIWQQVAPQEIIKFTLTAVNAWLLVMLGRRLRFPWLDCWWIAASFIIGSAYLWVSLGGATAYLAQVAATTGLLIVANTWASYRPVTTAEGGEQGYGRWWWSGFGVAFAGLCRPTTFLLALPLGLLAIASARSNGERRRRLLRLMLPVLAAGMALAVLNEARFDAWWELGYRLYPGSQRVENIFGLEYVPDNGYFLLLALPELVLRQGRLIFPYLKPNLWGMSILLTSPLLLSLFRWRPTEPWTAVWLIAVGVQLLAIFPYFGIGHHQIGYRYALDFLPFMYLYALLPFRGRPLPQTVHGLMFLGILVNGWMTFSYLYLYPYPYPYLGFTR